MGIYVFDRKKLFEYLEADENDPESSNDFGKNVIPKMLAAGERMFAYPFDGYWRDVGTIKSLWEANTDLLGDAPPLALNDDDWRIFFRSTASAPQYIGDNAVVEDSIIAEGSSVMGEVRRSVIGSGVIVEEGAVVENSVIMNDVRICSGARVSFAILDCRVTVLEGAVVGDGDPSPDAITAIGADVTVAAGGSVTAGAIIS